MRLVYGTGDSAYLIDENGKTQAVFEDRALAERCRKALAAEDVMQRRGVDWIFLERDSEGRIMVDCPDYGWIPGRWDDPFTAWVEADKWYTANIEGPTGQKGT